MTDPRRDLGIRTIDPDDEAGLAAYVAVNDACSPEEPESIENLRWASETYPATWRLLASVGGRPVGIATTGRRYVLPPEHERFWLSIQVLPDERGRGVGSALLAACSAIAREAGKRGFDTETLETRVDALRFLAQRGFTETARMRSVAIDLGAAPPAPAPPPDGIEIVTLAERPELLAGLHLVAREAFPDIPNPGARIDPGPPEEFFARFRHPDALPGATTVAIDRPSGTPVGYAALSRAPGSTTDGWHEMTAVRPAWRGRGIAMALKVAALERARALGLTRLETHNDVENAPMRAINRKLGFTPTPDRIEFAGPLAPSPAAAPKGLTPGS